MTNKRTVKNEQRFATKGSTERLSGREAGIVMTFSAICHFFVRSVKNLDNRAFDALSFGKLLCSLILHLNYKHLTLINFNYNQLSLITIRYLQRLASNLTTSTFTCWCPRPSSSATTSTTPKPETPSLSSASSKM